MEQPQKRNITLVLDSQHVSFQVSPEMEQVYRLAGEKLNERYRFYIHKMPHVSVEQLWTYVALDMAVNLYADAYSKRLEPIRQTISELNSKIESALPNPIN